MNKLELLSPLSDYIRELGKDIRVVQGGGGNFAVKDAAAGKMFVKPSGMRFSDMREDQFVSILLPAFCEAFECGEAPMQHFLQTHTSASHRASMETAMHAFLPRYSLHVHYTVSNIFLCMEKGEAILQDMFSDQSIRFVPYTTPGYALGKAIQEDPSASIFFLHNHGIIVCGDTLPEVQTLLALVMARSTQYLKHHLGDDASLPVFASKPVKRAPEYFLFPDAAVYSKKLESAAAEETLGAQWYLETMIHALSGTPRYISQSCVDELLNMESEQYRQRVIKNL